MLLKSHERMHQEHVQWKSENELWREQVRSWEFETYKAIEDLPNLQKALRDYEQELERHAASLQLREQILNEHEHALSKFEQGDASSELVPLESDHSAERQKHEDHKRVHELKRSQHLQIMKDWRALLKALGREV